MAGRMTFAVWSMVAAGGLCVSISGAGAAPSETPQKSFILPAVSGYLGKGETPDSLLILKAPPQPGSAAEARDREASADALQLHGSARWNQAVADSRLDFPAAIQAFDCTLGIDISPASTPRLYTMMQKTLLDFGLSTSPTKRKFQRVRPFMVNDMPMCTPDYENALRHDGSYPSGHSAVGYGWGMMLAAIAPDKSAQLISRGMEFGESRMVCNVHWASDVENGRVMASAVFARLSAVPQFRNDLVKAGREYRRAVAAKRLPKRTCS